jgi:hypothetical protein
MPIGLERGGERLIPIRFQAEPLSKGIGKRRSYRQFRGMRLDPSPWLPDFCKAGALRRAGMAQRASPTVQKLEDVDMSQLEPNLE